MAKDGQDTSAGRPRCETSNFGIYAVLTLEADMVKTCENNKLVECKGLPFGKLLGMKTLVTSYHILSSKVQT